MKKDSAAVLRLWLDEFAQRVIDPAPNFSRSLLAYRSLCPSNCGSVEKRQTSPMFSFLRRCKHDTARVCLLTAVLLWMWIERRPRLLQTRRAAIN